MSFLEDNFEINASLFTPSKDEAVELTFEGVTPGVVQPSTRPPTIVDEDSGLGMTPRQQVDISVKTSFSDSQVFSSVAGAKRSLFSLKRCSDGDVNGSITKKHRRDTGYQPDILRMAPQKNLFPDEPTVELSQNNIMTAVDRLTDDDLIGNGSQTFSLPTIPGKHSDLKSITPETMRDVLQGKFDDSINSYRIIDCRYPYEYDGGHIQNAENLYLKEQVKNVLDQVSSKPSSSSKRDILIFHCEFSSERGPKMSRFLRDLDRQINMDRYPFLHFPEIYLLHNGYKAFYETCKDFCEPMSYKPMLHSDHSSDLRHFRAKSKSWCAGEKRQRQRSHRLRF